jgi:hypothetical protein
MADIDIKMLMGPLRQRRARPIDPETIPVGTLVRTPTGKEARVEGYRGFRRDHIVRLVCRYVEPENKAFDIVLLPAELVVVVVRGEV